MLISPFAQAAGPSLCAVPAAAKPRNNKRKQTVELSDGDMDWEEVSDVGVVCIVVDTRACAVV